MSSIILAAKNPSATQIIAFNFLSQLSSPSETISSASVAISLWSGGTDNPPLSLSGAASISGTTVTQKVTGGTAGNIYQLKTTANTSLSEKLIMTAVLAVTESVT